MNCPHCGREHELHDGPARDQAPAPGDVSLCWGCGRLAIYETFAGTLGLRIPTPEEQADLDVSPEVRETRAVVAESYYPEQASELRWGPP